MLGSKLLVRTAIGIAGLLVVAFLLSQCTSLFTGAKEAKVAKGQAEASIQSGAEAMNTVSNVSAADAETDAIVQGGINEIRNAPEGQRGIAAQRAACRLHQYRDSERCAALRNADPADAARRR